jgi:SAM-dependent methyltransferase
VHAVVGTKVARLSVSLAYDAIAAGYDEQVRGDDWMRRKLHAHYRRVFSPGDRVLDVGCGTGIDASFLARQGISVVGIDASSEMILRLRARLGDVDARILRIEDLSRLGDERFDGIISAFASLNSVANLAGFADDAAALVRPGGRMVLHMLNRFSLWEWLGHVQRREWRAAASVGRAGRRRFAIGGQSVEHRVYSPSEACNAFRGAFQLRGAYGLGALRPPHTVQRVPRPVVAALEQADLRLGSLPLVRNAGRFFVLDLERRRAA